MEYNIEELVKQIKQSFRLLMDGVTSQSMREKGSVYKINWGISHLHLKEMAKQYEKNFALANRLWQEDIRECKLLATMLMPTDVITTDLANQWAAEIKSQDLAEFAAFNLFQHIDNAKELTLNWIAKNNDIQIIIGYQVLSRLLLQKMVFTKEEEEYYLQWVADALQSENIGIKHAAMNSLNRFSALSEDYKERINRQFGLDF